MLYSIIHDNFETIKVASSNGGKEDDTTSALATYAIIACLTITNPVCVADDTDDVERLD